LLPPAIESMPSSSTYPTVTVAMVNPLPQKGASIMAEVVREREPGWTFRVLRGAWGDSFHGFTPLIDGASCVEMLPYASEMSAFYRAAQLLIFPSRYEGYGLVPVEAMLAGTPVAATDYPAIREGVGDGARLVPHAAGGREWVAAIADVLANRDAWCAKARVRIDELRQREADETSALIAFLRALR
jgi:glycosyltransferase involved in cell wall biosynthesis